MSKKFSAVSIVLVLFLLVVGVLTYLMGPALWASRDNSFRTLTPSEVELEKVEKQDGAEFNFRTSLVIETPDGLVEGSVVRTATMRYSPRASGNGGTFSGLVKGEALAMEISPGKWLLALSKYPRFHLSIMKEPEV